MDDQATPILKTTDKFGKPVELPWYQALHDKLDETMHAVHSINTKFAILILLIIADILVRIFL